MPETAELRTEVAGVFAVCDARTTPDGTRYAVWHVGTSPEDTVPRLRGAWVVDDDDRLAELVRTRIVWALGQDAATAVIKHGAQLLDAAGTDTAVREALGALDAAFDAEVARSGKKLKRPDWGVTVELAARGAAADDADTDAAADETHDELVAAVLRAARRLEALARQWSGAQSLRGARKFLRAAELGGTTAAPLPYATK